MKTIIVRNYYFLIVCLLLASCEERLGDGVTLKDIEVGDALRVNLGTEAKARAYPVPWDCTDYEFTWSSDNPEIASVDNYGRIMANDVGHTVVYVSQGSIKKEIPVEVYEVTLTEKAKAVDGLVGLWLFDNVSDFEKAEVGKNLITYLRSENKTLGVPSTAGLSSVKGFNKRDGAVQIGHQSLFFCNHGIPAKGEYVGEYTIMWDICRPEGEGGYASLLNTGVANNSDQDVAIKSAGQIGVGTSGYSTNQLVRNKWYRIIVTLKEGEYYRIYVNGEKWLEGENIGDNRFKLEPEGTLLMGDEDSDDHTMYLSSVAIYGRSISESEITSLGGL